ncbi:hypothetical protein [Streptomyces sp. NPDC002758]
MRSTARQATEWLAAAATDPRACKRQWHGPTGMAELGCGRFWDVLSVPESLGVPALDMLLCIPQPPGPALANVASRSVSFFLPPDPTSRWIGSGIEYLSIGARIALPPPHRAAGPLCWLVPPDGRGSLFAPAAVELALQHALDTLRKPRGAAGAGQDVHGEAPHPPQRSSPVPPPHSAEPRRSARTPTT